MESRDDRLDVGDGLALRLREKRDADCSRVLTGIPTTVKLRIPVIVLQESDCGG